MRCAYDLKPSMQTSSTYILYFITFGVSSPPTLCFVAGVVGRYEARAVELDLSSEGDFFPQRKGPSFCLGFLCHHSKRRLYDGSCHYVFCENQKSSTRIETKGSSSFSSSFFVACADGKTNTTYSLFELEEHTLEAEILQLTFCGGSLHTYVLIYILCDERLTLEGAALNPSCGPGFVAVREKAHHGDHDFISAVRAAFYALR